MKHKYPVGSKVKFIYKNQDENKLGKVVGIETEWFTDEIRYLVLIPTSSSPFSGRTKEGVIYTWRCLLSQIQLHLVKNEQLLFDFMNEYD